MRRSAALVLPTPILLGESHTGNSVIISWIGNSFLQTTMRGAANSSPDARLVRTFRRKGRPATAG
jgi:hypothetical protein